ncbi:Gfo/Idh/MocA family protein [Actinomadura sp. WAC 06369]|uniref:Gfo/Idh/MocA family protein n=1 Tax=Actinomadura sp. WAC 06369 TaxID=2203193 RepID=UPI000F7A735D|nr:Gfo/Idh/MocA family oxidoreductase [Actinomadura sp. WAC 06369]RSN71063.1 gfo/Idh/MocA family oxidoreductase [Actinomadura sp. WAC 06369]
MRIAVSSPAHGHAATYARLLAGMPGVELVVADLDGPPDGPPDGPDRGPAAARRLGAEYAATWDEALASAPRAVVVTGAAARRREQVERAAKAGAQVLCEPPLAAAEADARAMVDACAAAGVRLTMASPGCFSPAFAAVREALAEGAAGRLTTVHGACNAPGPARPDSAAGAGTAAELFAAGAAHLLDMVDAVLGGEPAERVYAQANGVLGGSPDVVSAALLTVRYPSGVVAALDCSWSLPGDRPAADGPTMTFIGERASAEFTARPRLLGGFDAAAGGERWEPGGDDPSAVMLGAFVAAVGEGRAAGPDGAAGLRALRVVEAARESMRTGRPVDIE